MRLALTGGIASGKTLVADELGSLGAVVIDADLLARQVVDTGTPGLAEVVARFGDDVLLDDKTLDRARLGDLVFPDAQARADLNAIIHPRVRAAARRQEDASAGDAVEVHVIPLLVETGQEGSFDGVIVVDLAEDLQMSRLMRRNGLSEQQARDRMAAQASRAERLAAADWIIDNSGNARSTVGVVRALWDGPIAALRTGRPPHTAVQTPRPA